MQLRGVMFQNLIKLKMKMDFLYQKNIYHKYLAASLSSVDARRYVLTFADITWTEFCGSGNI